jgi:hypothetical protein
LAIDSQYAFFATAVTTMNAFGRAYKRLLRALVVGAVDNYG